MLTSRSAQPGREMSGAHVDLFRGTTLCQFYLAGNCLRGDSCKFAHGFEKLQDKPDFAKSRLCESFMMLGSCAEGAACSFAHGKQELRGSYAARVSRQATIGSASFSRKEALNALECPHRQSGLMTHRPQQNVQTIHSLQDTRESQLQHIRLKLQLQLASGQSHRYNVQNTSQASVFPVGKIDSGFDLENVQCSFSRQTTFVDGETVQGFSRQSTRDDHPGCVRPYEVPILHEEVKVDKSDEEAPKYSLITKNTFLHLGPDPSLINSVMSRLNSWPSFP